MNLAWTNGAVLTARASFTTGLFALASLLAIGCANGTGSEAECDPACPTFYLCCDGPTGPSCRDYVNDPGNCGGCGVTCPSGVCREGACVAGGPTDGGMVGTDGSSGGNCSPSCSSDQRCCGTTCISRSGVAVGTDGRSDPSFGSCNGCGIACDAERASACSVPGGAAMGTPRCMCGSLDQCRTGEICVADAGSFTCVSTSTDPNNCGAVGNACAMGESCVGGVCQCGSTGSACGAGSACCGGACVDVSSDAANCGGCGMACDAGESCQAGTCVCGSGAGARACTAPAAGNPGESCCDGTCIANTTESCACVACTGSDTCQVSTGGLIGGGGTPQVCCGDESVAILGCGGFGFGDGGFGFGDGGLPFP